LDYIKMAPVLSPEEVIKRTEDRFERCRRTQKRYWKIADNRGLNVNFQQIPNNI
jgi:hypothetical protein